MSGYTNFNRQENFNRIELSFLGNTIRTFTQYGFMCDFTNKIQGLYDGYLYSDLLEACDKFIEENKEEAKEDGNLVTLYRAKTDLKMIIEKVQALPVISQQMAHSLL